MATSPAASPAVSVIIPTHNRASLVCRAIKSVLSQTYQDLECIVVDDGSTDSTPQVIQEFTDPRLVYIRHDYSRLASAARNTGIRRARGKYIAFLDDDDEWLPGKLQPQVELLAHSPMNIGMVYCWMDYFSGGKKVSEHHPELKGYVFSEVLDRQAIGNASTLLVRSEIVKEISGFDEALPRGNDGDFIRRVCRKYDVNYIPEVLVKVYVDHGHERITRSDRIGILNGINSQKDKLVKFEKELKRYRLQKANILAHIGFGYGLIRQYKNSTRYFFAALRTAPYSIHIYLSLLRLLKRILTGNQDS